MTVHALWVINKAGGLVFSRSYSDTLPPLDLNTVLILAGTLHGIHAITSKLTPVPPSSASGLNASSASGTGAGAGPLSASTSTAPGGGLALGAAGVAGGAGGAVGAGLGGGGMEAFEAEGWGGRVYLTPTGTKFVLLHSIGHHGLEELLRRVYEIYSDAVMKNPFHTPEMPINSSLFETRLQGLMVSANG